MNHVLIVDDDADSAATMRELVGVDRFSVAVAHTLRDARRQMAMQPPSLVLLDLQLPDGNGMDLFGDQQVPQDSQIVLVTGHASLDSSIEALRRGAMDYLVKPVGIGRLEDILSRFLIPTAGLPETGTSTVTGAAFDRITPQDRPAATPGTGYSAQEGRFGRLWGGSAPMQRLYQQMERVAGTSVTVFLTGESGTGKEVVAQTLHELSQRRSRPFLAVNCGAISPHLIESEIFGHEKGSFTGADRQHQGFFERAATGTLFLDEITEMPMELQVKLLRVLETGRFMRVGSTQTLQTDVRVIAATNRCPYTAVASGKLREDLLYRLNVFPIELPPLRERLADVPLLARHFMEAISQREGQAKQFTASALKQLAQYSWPGNVRELRNAVQRAYVMEPGPLVGQEWLPRPPVAIAQQPAPVRMAAHALHLQQMPEMPPAGSMPMSAPTTAPIPPTVTAHASADHAHAAATYDLPDTEPATIQLPIGMTMAQAERLLIQATLKQCKYQKERTAAVLGISLKTLYNRLRDYAGGKKGETDAEPG
ncbi:sigma-54 dependent transcriptional regulator [Delftia acidovorans]|jgi:DNA-binding NtrC family response regulator|uniref:sigma-54-dependent transcriptional regulator n=1 Tax=Delftia acidovorans TaxID=80866 RepID=UPI00284AFCFA|nr:sigma-54 dependent transcriptional regulator [Delftia acidovorans]